ncbi:apolipoprotein N-acyltransferase [Candidatus Erwinia haradaeae]|uniref:Apolipoprotein N-acyltransferase n=1 Tax=Candidatus Erwinia haradaeae TaxID=1922217 RepID=A0A451DMM3_9GAMM|nr:apolipoprotein N-acyltransferase [Candidatus Erwinia haradaeae]VFP87930.1 Apolipoprotein N-acyltransferase [Candidatus Erwinia haradaeae]
MELLSNSYNQYLRLFAAFFTGALGTLSFSPYNFWQAAIASLCGLQSLTLHQTIRQASAISFIWGLGFFGSGLYWVYISINTFYGIPCILSVSILFLLSSYLALYPLLFIILLDKLCTTNLFLRLTIVAPIIWQITEFFRSWVLTGFPWLQFGYSQINGPLKGLAPLMGVESITFFVMMISGLVVYALFKNRFIVIVFITIIFAIGVVLSKITWYLPIQERTVNVALVQGNISPSIIWSPDQIKKILSTYIRLSKPYVGKVSIIIWPESALPDFESNQQVFLQSSDKNLRISGTTLVTGIIDSRFEKNNYATYNTIIVVGGDIPYRYCSENRYQKNHLVPFGEYLPLKTIARFFIPFFNLLPSEFSQGKYIQPQLQVAGYNITPALCYEVILGQKMRDNMHTNTDFLLTISNDAWFGSSTCPWQHLQMAQMRALELGRPLLYATNNGITAIINANGQISHIIPQFQSKVLTAQVTPTSGLTPYVRFGQFLIWGLTLLFSLIWLLCIFLHI